MRPSRALAVLAVALGAVLAPAVAGAATETAQGGDVQATLRYQRTHDGYGFRALHLTIARAGATLYDRAPTSKACRMPYCLPVGALGPAAGRVAAGRGPRRDGEPEVTFDYSTGGATAASGLQVFRLAADGRGDVRTDTTSPIPATSWRTSTATGAPSCAAPTPRSPTRSPPSPTPPSRCRSGASTAGRSATSPPRSRSSWPRSRRASPARYRRLRSRRDGQELARGRGLGRRRVPPRPPAPRCCAGCARRSGAGGSGGPAGSTAWPTCTTSTPSCATAATGADS